MLPVRLKFCVFSLADIELSLAYQNAHVNSVFEKVSFHSMFILSIFTVPVVTFINTKGSFCLEEFLMLLMDRNCNYFILTEIFG